MRDGKKILLSFYNYSRRLQLTAAMKTMSRCQTGEHSGQLPPTRTLPSKMTTATQVLQAGKELRFMTRTKNIFINVDKTPMQQQQFSKLRKLEQRPRRRYSYLQEQNSKQRIAENSFPKGFSIKLLSESVLLPSLLLTNARSNGLIARWECGHLYLECSNQC